VLHLIFFLFEVSSLITLIRLLFFESLFHLNELRLKLSDDILFLFFLKLFCFRSYVVDTFAKLILKHVDPCSILLLGIFFVALSNSELTLEFVNALSIVLLSLDIPSLSSLGIILNFLVFIFDLLQLSLNLTVPLIPLVRFYIRARVCEVDTC